MQYNQNVIKLSFLNTNSYIQGHNITAVIPADDLKMAKQDKNL
jgi:hypothetical protein